METVRIRLEELEQNTGQIPGLPGNPRQWTRAEVDRIAKSLRETPELFEARPIIVTHHAGKFVILGGNLRYEGCKRNKDKDAPCFVIPDDTTVDKMKEIIIKDNGSFGEWDYDALGNLWDDLPLADWGVPAWDTGGSLDAQQHGSGASRSPWNGSGNKSDLSEKIVLHQREDYSFVSCMGVSETGQVLQELKTTENEGVFVDYAVQVLVKMLQLSKPQEWNIVYPPRRRHRDYNFADAVVQQISEKTGVAAVPDAFTARTKQRINPEFTLAKKPTAKNIILYDDILTTGSTVKSCLELLDGYNVLVVIGIYNN